MSTWKPYELPREEKEKIDRQMADVADAWRHAALADGWTQEPTYSWESAQSAFSLKREGFKVLGISRKGKDPEGSISLWCPKVGNRFKGRGPEEYIDVGLTYDWELIYNEYTIRLANNQDLAIEAVRLVCAPQLTPAR